MGNKKRAQNLYAVLFSEMNWARWEVLIKCDDDKVSDTARELQIDIQMVLQEQLVGIENEVDEIKEIADELGVDITARRKRKSH